MRKIWLQKPNSNDIWDLLPQNAYEKNNACPFLDIKGMGYRQDVTQTQVDTEYYVSKVLSKNQSITGTLYFQDDDHIKAFQEFVGDFTNQLLLYYSPSGQVGTGIKQYYKKVIISIVDKTELDEMGWYLCPMTLATQDDVWSCDIENVIQIEGEQVVGEPLVYGYTYPYIIGGRNAILTEFNNQGRETGCEIIIENNGESLISNVEWFVDRTYIDYYGIEQEEVQRSKWNLDLGSGNALVVNSQPLTQEAKVVVNYGGLDENAQSVIDVQEPSWDYINFVRLPQGLSRIVFYVEENESVTITIKYKEQKELI